MEHLREFGLSRDPFVNDPVLQFYYESPVHRGAERRLMRGIAQHKGLCLLLGEPGAGKSMLVRHLLEELEEEAYEASLLSIVRGDADAQWLLARVAARLGVEEPAETPLETLAQCYDRLSAFREEGRRPVIVVDDAQRLRDPACMAALRALLELEYEDHHLLTLILVGEPGLDAVVALDPALPHRLDMRVTLDPFDVPTATAYLAHRVSTAGGHPTLLQPETVQAIQVLGRGLPRRMNTLADNALFEAHLSSRTQVLPEDVERAAEALGYREDLGPTSLADSMPPGVGGGIPGGEPIDLTHEVAGLSDDGLDEPMPAFEELEKDPEEASLFEPESPPTVVMDGVPAPSAVDDDVEELFDNLIED